MEQAILQNDELALSQLSLRKGLGLLGLALPVILAVACPGLALQRSISAYYFVMHLHDVLVGTLSAISAFLIFYRGYSTVPKAFKILPSWINRHMTDTKLTTLAGLGALATALLPTCEFQDHCVPSLIPTLHLISAVTFLATLAVLSIWSFTESDTDPKDWDAAKRWSNRVYTACGWTILASLVAAAAVLGFHVAAIGPFTQPVFWLESLAVWAFGISWLVKGEAIQAMVGLLRKK